MKKIILSITLLFTISLSYSQDTIPARKVKICNQLVNRKTGKVERNFYRWIKVKKGYIIRESDSLYVINGKEMKPNAINIPLTGVK
jgi:hypothetical protein